LFNNVLLNYMARYGLYVNVVSFKFIFFWRKIVVIIIHKVCILYEHIGVILSKFIANAISKYRIFKTSLLGISRNSDISRYDPDICSQGKSLRCHFFSIRQQSELLGQFRLIGDRACSPLSDVFRLHSTGWKYCLCLK